MEKANLSVLVLLAPDLQYTVASHINPEVTDYYVCLFVCVSPTQYERTVRCTDEVMCYCVRYGTVKGTVRYCSVLYGNVPLGIVHLPYDTVRYGTVLKT